MTISEAFLQGEPELVSVQHLLTDSFRLEIWETLKNIGTDKSLGIDGVSYEVYGCCLTLSPCQD